MEGGKGEDGSIAHRIICNCVKGWGRYVVLMLEGKNYLHVAQVQVWAQVQDLSPVHFNE